MDRAQQARLATLLTLRPRTSMRITELPALKDPLLPNQSEKIWVKTPGLVDLQVNGFAGVDYNTPSLTPEQLQHSLEVMLATGVTTCLPTVITTTEARLKACFAALERARNVSPLAQAMIAGYHLEGPFLSPLPGYSGCHPTDAMCAADPELFSHVQEAADGNIRLVTVAPEIEGVLPLIEKLAKDRIIVALGHTAADTATIRKAVDAGASLSTHLGNGTAGELAKNDNPIMAQLGEDRLHASFIADGYHLPPEVLRVYLRAKETERTILVTDAMAGAAAPPGRYRLGDLELERGVEPVVRDPVTFRPAGAAVSLDQCVRNVMRWFGISLHEAVAWAGTQPLRLLENSGAIAAPSESNQFVWWEEQEQGWQVKAARSGQFLFN
jgi:N-acetylglucosamine-6-phosphate deacetylase